MKAILSKSCLFLFFFFLSSSLCLAQEFTNLSLTERELNFFVDRSFSMGTTEGFSGIRPFPKIDLLGAYLATKDTYVYRYVEKDLMEIGLSPEGKNAASGFYLEPISNVTFRAYVFGTDVPNKKRYCIENMEGTCLEEGLNTFLNVTGQGRLHRNVTFFYEGQLKNSKEETTALLKKTYIKLKTGKASWQFGKDSLWLGHGRHGSFLLSNNAEPFLMFKFETEEPFRMPFFLSKLGEFKYTFFHGWLEDFNIIGHRLGWKPFSLLELGVNQTATYGKDQGFKVTDWPHILFSATENVPGDKFNTDQRASLDAALYMPFLNKLSPLKGGKLYVEYGGEDMFAWWQKEDKKYVGPFGFEFLGQGIILGLFLTTGETDFRAEYAENYRSYPIFYDWYNKNGVDYPSKGEAWYRSIPFLNKGVLLGHHIGPEAEDLYLELRHRFKNLTITGFFDRQKHHLYNKIDQFNIFPTTPEKRYQYGLDVLYSFKKLELNGTVIYNKYKNVNINPNILESTTAYNIAVGQGASETIGGIGIKYLW